MTYEFWTTEGRFLCVLDTDTPDTTIADVAARYSVDARDVVFGAYQEPEPFDEELDNQELVW